MILNEESKAISERMKKYRADKRKINKKNPIYSQEIINKINRVCIAL